MRYVGRSIKRFEDPRLLTGSRAFVDDLTLPDMLHAAVLRSQHAHARLRRVDVAATRALPGVVAVLSGADIAGLLPGIPTRAMVGERAVDTLQTPEYPCWRTTRCVMSDNPLPWWWPLTRMWRAMP